MSVDVSHWPSRNSSASRHSPNEVFDNGQLFLERWRGYHLQNHHTCPLCASLLQFNWHLPEFLFTKAGREEVKNQLKSDQWALSSHTQRDSCGSVFLCVSTHVVCFLAMFCTSKLRLGEQLLQALFTEAECDPCLKVNATGCSSVVHHYTAYRFPLHSRCSSVLLIHTKHALAHNVAPSHLNCTL